MNIKEIIKKYLDENGFDGLCSEDCGCTKEDLFPCDCPYSGCVPGYKWPSEDHDVEFYILEKKPYVEINGAKRDD